MTDSIEITPRDAAALLHSEIPPLLLDVRLPWEHDLSRIEGSLLIPLDELTERMQSIPGERAVVVYCHHGVRSLLAAQYLKAHGREAWSMSGGIDRWSLEIDPTLARY